MKKTFFIPVFLLLVSCCFAQHTEFKTYNNGFMYSDTTMSQLRFIVDSLNLKFKTCDLQKTYYSKYQAKGHYVSLEKPKIKEAKQDMARNLSFDDFVKKYPSCKASEDLLIVKYKYKNYDDKEVVEFSNLTPGQGYDYQITIDDPSIYDKKVKNTWITESSDNQWVSGFYFTEEFSSKPMDEKYARMVQYTECMVDTNEQIFYEKAKAVSRWEPAEETPKIEAFLNFADSVTGRPDYDSDHYEDYVKGYKLWDSLKFERINILKKTDPHFDKLLGAALAEAVEKGTSNAALEEYAARYISAATALELKRNRIVVGGCSMDRSPRIHALEIAKLSAETIKWDIFLRAHLDIMNDRFERVSDGSWAQNERQTYIAELEALDINVADLMLGISLRLENPGKNHYYGSINRIGRALAETKYADEIEEKMIEMIKDNKLDDYNRLLIYYLFDNYNYSLKDEAVRKENEDRLKDAVTFLPPYLSSKFK